MMASGGKSSAYQNQNGYPKTMYTLRTRSMLPSRAPRSSSAMSTRTYSRVKGNTPFETNVGAEVRRSMNFDESDSCQLDDLVVDMTEMESEKELLKRMIDQQKQLQELKERQKRVLELQQQLASMEEDAEYSMEEKLDKLKTAKTRLDELQKLVSTIKAAGTPDTAGSGDNQTKSLPDQAQVKRALEELSELKTLIGMVSESTNSPVRPERKQVVTMEPVFPNSVEPDEQMVKEYQPVLPEVNVVQYEGVRQKATKSAKKPILQKRASNDIGRDSKESPLNLSLYSSRRGSSTKKKKKTVRTISPKKEKDPETSERLLEEMRRHQVLLKELQERRRELEELMNLTRGTEDGEEEEVDDQEEDYNDTNASVRSNIGSPDESRGVSDDDDGDDFETSQSGRLFGLNETDTRRLIDLIRNQKNLGAATEKTTATWGSSSTSGTSDSHDQEDRIPVTKNDQAALQMACDKQLSKVSDMERINAVVSTSVKDAFTQLDEAHDHEIDFRPPTRRRRNLTQPEPKAVFLDHSSYVSTINKLQEDLVSSNSTMRILLDDQLSLTKLLLNTLNLQQTAVPSNLCYGISPDFLIYQLDNCCAQFAATLKQTKDWQWQVYSLTKNADGLERPATRQPLGPLHLMSGSEDREPVDGSRLQMRSSSRQNETTKIPSRQESNAGEPQPSAGATYPKIQREETNNETGNDLFEAMRDSIYSEAAILISQNETRPHFLIELFHTLQQLNTDYLRQHALYTLQDVMKGYIPASPRKIMKGKYKESPFRPGVNGKKKIGSFSENTPSESAVTSEDEVYAKLKEKVPEVTGYDYSLKVSSGSECSTPSEGGLETNPFAADDLGSTVIHLDAALRHMREMERIKQELQNSANAREESAASDKQKVASPQINTRVLRVWIKNIVSEIIPILKSNHDKIVGLELVQLLQSKVLQCVGKGMKTQQLQNREKSDEAEAASDVDKLSIADFFSGQLKSILDDSFTRFIGHPVSSCGEDMIVGLSEILFNELAFFHMMQDLGKEKQTPVKSNSIPIIKIQPDETSTVKQNGVESHLHQGSSPALQNEDDSEVSSRDDDNPMPNGDDQAGSIKNENVTEKEPVTVDLSVSETKPLTSYGSGEDEEEGSGDEYEYKEQDVPTSMQQDSAEVQDQDENQEEDAKEQQVVEDPSDKLD